eukprot:scaffold3670_cov124-Cylindrotheca_fusiformis.AAC.23
MPKRVSSASHRTLAKRANPNAYPPATTSPVRNEAVTAYDSKCQSSLLFFTQLTKRRTFFVQAVLFFGTITNQIESNKNIINQTKAYKMPFQVATATKNADTTTKKPCHLCHLAETIKTRTEAIKTRRTEAIKRVLHHRRSSNHSDHVSHRTESSISSGEDSMESSHLARSEQICMDRLKSFCDTSGIKFSDETIFRFACFHSFKFDQAKEAIEENRDNHYLNIKMKSSLKGQFVSKAFFPLPGLKTVDDSEVLYLRPSHYCPAEMEEATIIESLCYALNDMSDTEEKCRKGIAVISNMKGVTRENFDEEGWLEFMLTLQGEMVPTKVNLLLIVHAPSWFRKDVFKSMKTKLSSSFNKKVHQVKSEHLSDYLMEGFRAYLPSDLSHGYRDPDEIVEDYVDLKSFQDERMSFTGSERSLST